MKDLINRKKNSESNKFIYFQIGMVIALLAVLYAFEFKSYEKYEITKYDIPYDDVPVEFIEPTVHKKPPPSPPPDPVAKIKVDITNLVKDDPIYVDVATNQKDPIPIYIPVFEPEPDDIDDIPISIAEEQPSFPGGISEMMEFIANNIVYPELARKVNITGTVYIEFVVEKDGSLSRIKILRGIGGGCEEEAIRVINLMPKWNCGRQNHIPVRVRLTIPIKFSLM